MVKLTIRGGDLDLVEYELEPFPPGKQRGGNGHTETRKTLQNSTVLAVLRKFKGRF
mgnify:CR=1 FL=1